MHPQAIPTTRTTPLKRRDSEIELEVDPTAKAAITARQEVEQYLIHGGEKQNLMPNSDPPRRTALQNFARNYSWVANPFSFGVLGGGMGMTALLSGGTLATAGFAIAFAACLCLYHVDDNLTKQEMQALQGQVQYLQRQLHKQQDLRLEQVLFNSGEAATTYETDGDTDYDELSPRSNEQNVNNPPDSVVVDINAKVVV
jgi:hypothetical protein